jgi:hypothetical protein
LRGLRTKSDFDAVPWDRMDLSEEGLEGWRTLLKDREVHPDARISLGAELDKRLAERNAPKTQAGAGGGPPPIDRGRTTSGGEDDERFEVRRADIDLMPGRLQGKPLPVPERSVSILGSSNEEGDALIDGEGNEASPHQMLLLSGFDSASSRFDQIIVYESEAAPFAQKLANITGKEVRIPDAPLRVRGQSVELPQDVGWQRFQPEEVEPNRLRFEGDRVFVDEGGGRWAPTRYEDQLGRTLLNPEIGSSAKTIVELGQDHVAAILNDFMTPDFIDRELDALDELREAGVPVIDARRTEIHGQPAIIYPRMALSSRDIWAGQFYGTLGETPLNQTSIDDLQRIRQIFVEKGIWVDDFECLISREGRVVVSDPVDLDPVQVGRGVNPQTLEIIDSVIEEAQRNIARKGT